MVLGSQANWTWLSSETGVHVCVLVGNQSSSWGRRALYSGLPLRGVALGKASSEENPRSVSKRRGKVAPGETIATRGKAISGQSSTQSEDVTDLGEWSQGQCPPLSSPCT